MNFSEICGMMKRPVDHLQQFVLAEFGTEGAIAGQATARAEGQGQDGQLVLKAGQLVACCGTRRFPSFGLHDLGSR